jgi:hypothetical protein
VVSGSVVGTFEPSADVRATVGHSAAAVEKELKKLA